MSGRVAGKKALITGAGQGIGAAAARLLAQEGAQVLVTDVNEPAARDQAAAINADLGEGTAFPARLDVTSEEEWIAALQAAREAMGGLSVLVNNAGVVLTGSVEDFDLDEWHRGMSINVDSVFLGCKHAIPLLRENQPGSIVNLSSIAGLIASPTFANYNASKAAVWLLSKSVALHCARKGWDVRCNSVHPTFIRTPILQDLVGDKDEATVFAKLEKQVPLGRLGEADEVAQAVLYLASDESRFVTASELKIDGGISAM
ncbi:SDR family oxidoreductase [Novosphingobium beihaiensis]|uniref:SDR family oxidoreductase n=1 Tax=Novosphingobium beihaiensis TaxID=2930389 RepID=A0ABT0BRD3_9SPHN|nr:SDR family oxidoreductase [Novosphingobium beihaiensis]MCJ2187618.1 SDR family oxidoreductase [Novosphingobium beihaiensis]